MACPDKGHLRWGVTRALHVAPWSWWSSELLRAFSAGSVADMLELEAPGDKRIPAEVASSGCDSEGLNVINDVANDNRSQLSCARLSQLVAAQEGRPHNASVSCIPGISHMHYQLDVIVTSFK